MALPVNTADCLLHLFPKSTPLKDWRVTISGGDIVSISGWNDSIGTQPTESEILAVSNDAKITAKWRLIRKKRDRLLTDTDKYAVGDRTLADNMIKYRQDLRDLPETYESDPDSVVFPNEPE